MKLDFEWGKTIILKTNEIKNYTSIDFKVEVEGVLCYMQLDLGSSETALIDSFVKKHLNHKRALKKKLNEICYLIDKIHIKKENHEILIDKCYVDIVQNSDSKKEDFNSEKIPFAGFLGVDFFCNNNFCIDFKNNYIKLDNQIKVKNNFKFQFNNNIITFPISINSEEILCCFDTATGDSEINLNNNYVSGVLKIKKTNMKYKDLKRPDFTLRSYYYHSDIECKINDIVLTKNLKIDTFDKKTDTYYYKQFNYKGVIGNKLFRDFKISFDFETMNFKIERASNKSN